MNDLKMFKSEESVNDMRAISSREVAGMMEVQHKNLISKIEKHTKILEKVTELNFKLSDLWQLSSYKDSTGRTLKEYLVTKKGCEFLAHKTTGEKGDIFTIRYMNKFEEMEKYIKKQEPKVPTTYKEALKHLLLQVEENERLQLENEEHQKTIGEMSPKAKYFDDLVDKDLLLNFRDTAKELEIKQKDFIEFLINNKYIFRDNGGNLKPYSTSISKGFFKIREFVVNNHAGTQTLITPKGREYFNKKIKNISE